MSTTRQRSVRPLCRLVLFAATSFIAIHSAHAAEPLKACFVYSNPVGDSGWSYEHDQGRQEMEKALKGKVTTKFVENVAEGADAARVIRNFAQEGCKLIFTASFGFMNPTMKVAEQFPGTVFMNGGGYKTAKNVGNYVGRTYEGRYLGGVIAGKMSKSGVAGYIASFPIPEILQDINAFTLGMRSVNPSARVKVIWINSWYDPGRERDATNTLITQGADVLTYAAASPATVVAAAAKGVYSVGFFSDMARFGPKSVLTSVTNQWGNYYTAVAQQVLNGTWKPSSTWGGMKDGFIKMAPLNSVVPADVKADFAKVEERLIDGKVKPFDGPVVDQDGKVRVAAEQTASDAELHKMDYFVKGVEGNLTK